MNAFKYEVVVGKNGRIEIPFSDLPEGESVEAIFLMRSSAVEARSEEIYQNHLASLTEEQSDELKFTTDIEELQKLQTKLKPLDKYEVFVTNNEIVFKKISRSLTWEGLSERIEAVGDDPNQPSLQEISEIVKEVRQSRRTTNA